MDERTIRQVAEQVLDEQVRPNTDEDLVLTEVREYPTCWVVGYNTREFVETGSFSATLVGGGPIIINRKTARARVGTSALPIEDQLDRL